MQNSGDVIGSSEAADMLKIDRSTLTRKVERGELTPVSKLPGLRGAYIFRRADIEALLEGRAA